MSVMSKEIKFIRRDQNSNYLCSSAICEDGERVVLKIEQKHTSSLFLAFLVNHTLKKPGGSLAVQVL